MYYNISKGGDGGIGRSVDKPDSYWSDPIKREQALKKQSESLKRYFAEHPGIRAGSNNTNYGKKASTELRQKISEGIKASGCSERSSRFAGHHHSEESKKRIGDWNRGKR